MGFLIGVGMALALALVVRFWARSAPRPAHLGVRDGHLAPCGASPNCVASQAESGEQALEPFHHSLSIAAARELLLEILSTERGARVVVADRDYVAAEFQIPAVGFIDDVEFLLLSGVIHFRSASRVGYSDLGVNAKRMQGLCRRLEAAAGERS